MNWSDVASRLSQLEARHRRLKSYWTATVIATLAILLMAQAPPRPHRAGTLEAERFLLRDGSGVERARLEVLSGGSVALSLVGQTGRGQALLAVAHDGTPHLSLLAPSGKAAAAVRVLPNGQPES